MDLERLTLKTCVEAGALEDPTNAVALVLRGLTPADLLGIALDALSRLPQGAEFPSLEFGPNQAMYDFIEGLRKSGTVDGFCVAEDQSSAGLERACVRLGTTWVGASRPKTEGR